MRLIRGPNLKDLIVARQLDVGRTLRILAQAGDALDAAHEAGLIHRDIKPHNILVAVGRDHAYLADFGVTKAPGDRSLTRTGALVGTLDYISPEQIRGHRATSASDVYAFTCVLYECLTGVVPFPKDSDAAVLYAHVAESPPLVTDLRPELPPSVDGVLQRGMSKEAEDRPVCAGDLIRDLEAGLGESLSATIAAPGPIQSPEQAGIRRRSELTATPIFAGPATRPDSPAPPTRQAPESPAPPTRLEGEPGYGVHWIGEQYTPVGEAAVATRAAPPAYTELAAGGADAPARNAVRARCDGRGHRGDRGRLLRRQLERRVGRRGRSDARVGGQPDRLEARRLAAARAGPDRPPDTARNTGRTRPDRTARQRRPGRRHCRCGRTNLRAGIDDGRAAGLGAQRSRARRSRSGSRRFGTGTWCRPASAAP